MALDMAQVGGYGGALLSAFDQVHDVFVFVKDDERRFAACNAPFAALLGFREAEDVIGLRDEDISPSHLVEHYRSHDEHVLATGESLLDLVELVLNSDGSYDWFLTSKTAIRDAAGTVCGVVGVTRTLAKRQAANQRILSLTPAVELIISRYGESLTVEEMANSVMMSVSHFNRTFKAHFGVTPHQYLRRVRLTAAADLLSTTTLPMFAIAARTGFYDQSHLTNEFRREHGESPTAYRRRQAPLPAASKTRMMLP